MMKQVKILTSTDASIRTPLLSWLRQQHPDHLTAKMLEEFKMPRPSARIDVALVNGEMAGFEIKSDRDTLNRLTVQIPAFSKFFDRVSLVTTPRHLKDAKSKIPPWWGIVVFGDDGRFRVVRTSRRNKNVDVRALLFALSKKELIQVARMADAILATTLKKETMVEVLTSTIASSVICNLAREVIKIRTTCC